ncbi:pentatricopeptide repeat domain-containing protein [Colletotrichum higginsianum]|nr:pentatricopeptide repeat domain-containing protein [Colletotrichum higginsianum]
MRSILSRLQEEGALASYGITDVESIAKDFEGKLGDASNPEDMMARLDDYIKDLESQLDAAGFDVSGFDDSNPVATMDVIEATARQDPSKRKKYPRFRRSPKTYGASTNESVSHD